MWNMYGLFGPRHASVQNSDVGEQSPPTHTREACEMIGDIFDSSADGPSPDWGVVRRARPVYDRLVQAALPDAEQVRRLHSECASAIPDSPTRRRKNAFFALTGRPLETGRFAAQPLRPCAYIDQSQPILDQAAGEHLGVLLRGGGAEEIPAMKAALRELQDLANAESPTTLRGEMALIAAYVADQRWSHAMVLLQHYQTHGGTLRAPILEPPDALSLSHTLTVVNHAHEVVDGALAHPEWRGWAREILQAAMRSQQDLMGTLPAGEAQRATATALAENRAKLRQVESMLGIPKGAVSSGILSEEEEDRTWGLPIEQTLKGLPETDAARRLGLRKLATVRRGSPEERQAAKQFFEFFVKLPVYKNAGKPPEVIAPQTAEEGNALRARARAAFAERIVGHSEICEGMVDKLGVWLGGGDRGFNVLMVGPSGVGKTSIGEVLASVFGRDLHTIQANNIDDKGELIGDKRMYRDAVPGALTHALLDHDKTPVILIDEFDKASPAAQKALLDAFSHDRNSQCRDRFFEDIPLDYSKAIFVLTANSVDDISKATRDRAFEFTLRGLDKNIKREVLRREFPKAWARAHLPEQLLPGAAISEELLNWRADEPGVRGVMKDVDALAAHLNTLQSEGRLPEQVTIGKIKRSIEKTWADVEPWAEGDGFIANVHLGGAGREGLQRECVFRALDNVWRLTMDADKVNLEIMEGRKVSAYYGFGVADISGDIKHSFYSRYQATYKKDQSIAWKLEDMEPLIPEEKDKAYAPLIQNNGSTLCRIVLTRKSPWFWPKDLLEKGMASDTPVTQSFEEPAT